MKKSIGHWCFPQSTTIRQCIDGCKGLFYSFEAAFTEGGELSLNTSDEEILDIRKYAESNGIFIKSLATSELWKYPLSTKDEEKRKRGIEIVKGMLHAAKLLGAEAVLVVPGLVDEENDYESVYRTSQASIKELEAYARAQGVIIAIENVWNKFLLSPLEYRDYIDSFNSEFIKAYFDVGNVLNFGYPEQWIRILGHRIVKVHVKDFRTAAGNGWGFVTLLEGSVNWKKVREALIEVGYEGILTAEIPPMYDAKIGIKYLSEAMDIIV